MTDDDLIEDILTKETVTKYGLEDVLVDSRLDVIYKGRNEVVEVDGEVMEKNKKKQR